MKNVGLTIYVKNGKTWEKHNAINDVMTVYKALAEDLQAKYIFKAPYVKRVIQHSNYDGTRDITVYYDNGVKHEYTVFS